MVETTLSFARKPEIREVQIRQSPSPAGRIMGTKSPEIAARMLSLESEIKLKCRSKLFNTQITIVARRMTVNAL